MMRVAGWLVCAAVLGWNAGAAQAQTTLGQCPDNFEAFTEETEPVVCTCPANSVRLGSVWGTDIYTADSGVCQAALHAGMIGDSGGQVTVRAAPGRRSYYGTTRNGVRSSNYGQYNASFRFEGTPLPAAPPDVTRGKPAPADDSGDNSDDNGG